MKQDNIRVNAILPGSVDTEMLRAGLNRGHLQEGNMEGLIRSPETKTQHESSGAAQRNWTDNPFLC